MCYAPMRIALQLDLAAFIDVILHFFKAAYDLERDGPLVLSCYGIIERVRMAVQSALYMEMDSITHNLCSRNPLMKQQYTAYAVSRLQPGISYFITAF